MDKFVRSLITEWRKLELPFVDETIIVGVSGGADSVSLLLGINDLMRRKKLQLQIIVAHFNHRLRGKKSDSDEDFVRVLADKLESEFVAGYGSGKVTANLEEKARNERYRFLLDVAHRSNAKFLLTAHTVNDQAETFLMNLIRGSGPDGLSGMGVMRSLDDRVILARPLLRWARRDDTETYCHEQAVVPRTDEMNADERFTRVRIRKTIIPELAKLNPRIIQTLARTADLIGSKTEADSYPGRDAVGQPSLELKTLRQMSKPELYAAIRAWLREMRGDLRSIQLKHIEAVERLIFSPKSGRSVELPGRGAVVRHSGKLVFRNIKVEK